MKPIVKVVLDKPLTEAGAARIADIQSREFDFPNEDPRVIACVESVPLGKTFTLFNKTYRRQNTARAGENVLFRRAGDRLYADERDGRVLIDGRIVMRSYVGLYIDRLVLQNEDRPRSYHRADEEFEALIFGATAYDAILGVQVQPNYPKTNNERSTAAMEAKRN